jgi:hypothetical protein
MNKTNKTILSLIGMSFAIMLAQSAQAEPENQGTVASEHAGHNHEGAKARHEKWQKMTPEERSAKREQMQQRRKNMSPEQHAAMRNRDPGVNARQSNQHERIEQGVHSGALTKDEAKGLASEQRSIRQEERRYKSDGVLTKDERKDLHQDLNAASKDIYNEKHDAEHR